MSELRVGKRAKGMHLATEKLRHTTCLISTMILLSLIALNQAIASGAVCPNANDIKPCTCDDEGLQCLKLNDSGLTRVFQAPAERKAIRRVWIFQTNLTELPERAFGDYIIRDLYLDLNRIAQVKPNAFGEAAATLQSLSLTRNSLEKFPFEDLAGMGKLRQLGLGYNNLKSIAARAFAPSDTLESLDLSHNSIERIEADAFAELYEVSLIDLSRNNLREIESNALRVKSSYRHLAISLRGNQISKLAADAFGNYHPYNLDLSRNKLTYLDELIFGPLLTNDTIIYVEDNRFSCDDCELYKWLLELDKNAQANLINFVCLDETKLEDLTLESIGCSSGSDVSSR